MVEIEQFIKVDEKQSHEMTKLCWFNSEKPYIMTPIEYRIKENDVFSSGFLMFTQGILYILKKNLSVQNLFTKIHLLNCKAMTINTSSILLTYSNDHSTEKNLFIELKSEFSITISQIMIRIFNEITFGIQKRDCFSIKLGDNVGPSVLTSTNIKESTNPILTMRTICFCHYYCTQKDDTVTSLSFLEHFDKHPHSFITFTAERNLGQYSIAFGHSIALDPLITTVIFDNYNSPTFHFMLKTLFEKSIFKKSIAFVNYSSMTIVNFEFSTIKKLNIRSWTFLRNSPEFMIHWANEAGKLIAGIDTLHFEFIRFAREEQCSLFLNKLCYIVSKSTLKTLHFSSFNVRPFPYNSLLKLITAVEQNLESLIFSSMDVDATKILNILCHSSTKLTELTHICFTRMQFRTVISNSEELMNLHLPPKLLYINVSGCYFTPASFKFFLSFLNKDLLDNPIHLEANLIEVVPSAYEFLSTLEFDILYPNLCEVVWNQNTIPSEWAKYFFAFLYTQKSLRFLSLNKIKTNNPTLFLQYVMQLIAKLKLQGIDICSECFEKKIFNQFVSALTNANFLRRIGLAQSNLGDNGLKKFGDVINNLTFLTEITADGANPTFNSFVSFYDSIVTHPSIVAIDKPASDYLRMKERKLISDDEREYIKLTLYNIRRMSVASTSLQRSFYIKSLIDNENSNNKINPFIGQSPACEGDQCLIYLESVLQDLLK